MTGYAATKRFSDGYATRRGTNYARPNSVSTIFLNEALSASGKMPMEPRRLDLFGAHKTVMADIALYVAGDISLLSRPSVAIVGTRQVTDEGRRRARHLAIGLTEAGIVVTSGLAKGVDAAAHAGAIDADGRTIAVIGTPLDKAYPAENSDLQERIWRNHLLISPFAPGEMVFKGNFPKRNRVMAALSDATVIIEASDTSGTLHQAAECQQLGRWLFIAKSVVDDKSLTWPDKFLGKPNVAILSNVSDITDKIKRY